ncbi:hypothetical protein ACT00Z_11160 [Bacillus stercoris]|uniref:hypothetical protein n=1 Tax=Bacillus stercoris TaxID=2054641 RepID=UPI0011C79477|nr:hypothetical protein FUA19_06315 [Bacillus subtilis]
MKIKKLFTSALLLTSLMISAAPVYASNVVKSQDDIRMQGNQMEMTVVKYYTREEARSGFPNSIDYAENGWYGTLYIDLKTWEQQPDGRYRVEYKGTVYLGL